MKPNNESDQNKNDRIDRIEIIALAFAFVGTTGIFTVIGTVLLQKYFSFWVAFAISLPIAFVICFIVHNGQGSIDAAAQTAVFVIVLLALSPVLLRVQQRRALSEQQKPTSAPTQIQKVKQQDSQTRPQSTPARNSINRPNMAQ